MIKPNQLKYWELLKLKFTVKLLRKAVWNFEFTVVKRPGKTLLGKYIAEKLNV